MSTPPLPPESKPSPWLTFAVPLAFSIFTSGVVWGALGSDVRHLERRVTTTEGEVSRVSTAQTNAREQAARIEAQLDAMNRELSRLARAIEKLADSPRASR
ncbi:hypothetical protein JQX13_38950 [Archangium violaceum]|uniref:hypothetical protein n=1 Tax=Archangium violaceum TaxID=83451 RepID=UPI00193B50CE|nr:hypothetical protein [Archangium violaceum]QRK06061.1 hypothetical protein JQX13_38950 [Archangium violaceum]